MKNNIFNTLSKPELLDELSKKKKLLKIFFLKMNLIRLYRIEKPLQTQTDAEIYKTISHQCLIGI